MSEQQSRVKQNTRYVVRHRPGPKWESGLDFRGQKNIEGHVNHYAQWHTQGRLELGGPFLTPDSGGMMVTVKGIDLDELEAFVKADPAVQSGLLEYFIFPWYTAMELES